MGGKLGDMDFKTLTRMFGPDVVLKYSYSQKEIIFKSLFTWADHFNLAQKPNEFWQILDQLIKNEEIELVEDYVWFMAPFDQKGELMNQVNQKLETNKNWELAVTKSLLRASEENQKMLTMLRAD